MKLCSKIPLTAYEAIFDFTIDKFKTENLYNYLLKENIQFIAQKLVLGNSKRHFESTKSTVTWNNNFTTLKLDFIDNAKLKGAVLLSK
jgi:hypothetical protein